VTNAEMLLHNTMTCQRQRTRRRHYMPVFSSRHNRISHLRQTDRSLRFL